MTNPGHHPRPTADGRARGLRRLTTLTAALSVGAVVATGGTAAAVVIAKDSSTTGTVSGSTSNGSTSNGSTSNGSTSTGNLWGGTTTTDGGSQLSGGSGQANATSGGS